MSDDETAETGTVGGQAVPLGLKGLNNFNVRVTRIHQVQIGKDGNVPSRYTS